LIYPFFKFFFDRICIGIKSLIDLIEEAGVVNDDSRPARFLRELEEVGGMV
jgi:hypothetical protein